MATCGHMLAPMCGCPADAPDDTDEFGLRVPTPPTSAPTPAPVTAGDSALSDALLDATLSSARDRLKRSTVPSKRLDGTLLARVIAADVFADKAELGAAALAIARHGKGATEAQIRTRLTPCASGTTISALQELAYLAVAYVAAKADAGSTTAEFRIDEKSGLPDASQRNIDIALGRLGVAFAYDLLAERKIIFYGPGQDAPGREPFSEIVQDKHLDRVWLEIDERYKFRPVKDFFMTVVSDRARSNEFHPVLNYLEGLPPCDGAQRLDTWLIRLCGAKDTPYVRAVSRLVLVAAVRRVRQPGCKFDEMLILESITQGTDKTTFVRSLCANTDWFGSSLPLHADKKKQMEATSGKWIIEAGELSGMDKADHRDLKDYLSTQVDEDRMAYAREKRITPRHFVIIATTNDKKYLKDAANRRYWPIEITRCDVAGLIAEREQLWAEACAAEATGESIRLAEELWTEAAAEQDERRIMDPFEAVIVPALEDIVGLLAIEDAWRLCGLDDRRPTLAESQRIIEIITKRLGWEQGRRRKGTRNRVVCFVAPGAQERQWITVSPSTDGWVCEVPSDNTMLPTGMKSGAAPSRIPGMN